MNRRDFLTTSALLGAAGATGLLAATPTTTTAPSTPAEFSLAPFPLVLNATSNSALIACPVTSLATGWVEYGTDASNLNLRATPDHHGLVPFDDRALLIPVSNLRPGTQYFYRVSALPIDYRNSHNVTRGPTRHTEVRSFRTLDPTFPTCRFTVWNDTHEMTDTISALSKRLLASNSDFLLWNGDVTNQIEDDAKLVTHYITHPATATNGQVPLFFSRGNHDVRGRAARRLDTYSPWPDANPYYFLRHGPVAILVLDTGEDKPDDTPVYAGLNAFSQLRDRQRDWLAQIIEHPDFRSAPHRIAVAHIPLVWDAPMTDRQKTVYGDAGYRGWVCDDGHAKWHDLLVQARVSLILSGHIHTPYLFPPTAAHPYTQLIAGGPRPEQAAPITVHATANELEVSLHDLTGKQLHHLRLPPHSA